ncbi:double zinc ribbon domain-containing protein [Sphingopyxis sp. PET50]|uniref:double zinc ribbon domain-containing protein n=1 Tax=Sphingopyxis sp. PET50 TaxID=2976533 RepID=UPI00391A61F9
MGRAAGQVESGVPVRAAGLMRGLRRAGRLVLDYALPPRCPACGVIVADDRQFCLDCWQGLEFLDGPACARCSIPLLGRLAR